METAKVLGLDVPWQLQQLADAVIEQSFCCAARIFLLALSNLPGNSYGDRSRG
jgi:hypothetical protein